MTIVRVGSNPKYAAGWDRAFGNKAKKSATSTNSTKASAKTKSAKAKSGKTAKSGKK